MTRSDERSTRCRSPVASRNPTSAVTEPAVGVRAAGAVGPVPGEQVGPAHGDAGRRRSWDGALDVLGVVDHVADRVADAARGGGRADLRRGAPGRGPDLGAPARRGPDLRRGAARRPPASRATGSRWRARRPPRRRTAYGRASGAAASASAGSDAGSSPFASGPSGSRLRAPPRAPAPPRAAPAASPAAGRRRRPPAARRPAAGGPPTRHATPSIGVLVTTGPASVSP